MNPTTLLESMEDWTPEQLLAVHDFCQVMADLIWKYHDKELLDHLNGHAAQSHDGYPPPAISNNLSLPFDDYLPP